MKQALQLFLIVFFLVTRPAIAQDTFSIVAVDTVTGEVGSAGASCVDLIAVFPNYAIDFLGDLLPGVGAINTQASYLANNQNNARTRMLAGDTPAQIISWLVANDAQFNPASRQYGIAAIVNGSAQTEGYTGTSCFNYKNHIAGVNYCIQGNILLGQSVLDSMEQRFLAEPGDLACKLMAALQGAKVTGADTRCTSNGTSSLFAFVKVSQPGDPYGSPSLSLGVKTPSNAQIEPIDSLQTIFTATHTCTTTGLIPTFVEDAIQVFPIPARGSITVLVPDQQWVNATYSLFDNQQRLLTSGSVTSDRFEIEIASTASGIYILQLEQQGKSVRKKVVLEK